MDIKSSISKREKSLIVLTALVISFSIIYAFAIVPFYKKFIQLNQEINIKQARLAKSLKLLKEKDLVSEEFKKYSQRLSAKSSQEEEMALVLSEIEKIGKSAGIYLSDVKPQKIKDMGFYRTLLVEVKFQAEMQALSKFIYDLQNSDSILKVTRLQINTKGQESSFLEGIIQVSKIILS